MCEKCCGNDGKEQEQERSILDIIEDTLESQEVDETLLLKLKGYDTKALLIEVVRLLNGIKLELAYQRQVFHSVLGILSGGVPGTYGMAEDSPPGEGVENPTDVSVDIPDQEETGKEE